MERLVRRDEAAEMCGVSVETIRAWVKRGHLPSYRLGREALHLESDVLRAEKATRDRGAQRP